MKKVFKLDELDCANCAAKMEDALNRLDGVEKATINFMMKKLTIVADENEMERIVAQAQKVIKKIEPDCVIVR